MTTEYERLASRSRICVLANYVFFLLMITLGTLVWPSCDRPPNGVVWGIQIVILLLFLPGILKQNVRTHVWLAFILLGFFIMAVNTAFACYSAVTLLEVVAIVGLFISSLLYIRWRSRALNEKGSHHRDGK